MMLAGEGAPGRPGGPCPPPVAAAAANAGFIRNWSCAIWNMEARSPAPPGGVPAAAAAPGRTPDRPPPLFEVGTPKAPRRGFCEMK